MDQEKKSITIDSGILKEFLGPKKFLYDSLNDMDEIGIVCGLAWTSSGGDTLFVEVNIVNGTGKIELTGKLGDVMKESAYAAISYIRSRAEAFHIEKDFYQKYDIHIHFPEGAVPKDGPSAGITIATALISELTKTPVRRDIAMTGEITIRGRVLPIGGLKEKSMAAYRAGVKTVIIPKENERDLTEIDKIVLNNVRFIPVSNMDEVVSAALLLKENTVMEEIIHPVPVFERPYDPIKPAMM
ncbi:Lon protease 1 [bioreactor metagenome]|uniref:Lon protease 1 n=1 Tax=bioreactor metagenome TaxID=1076179 RepID=A0A645DKL5_9ZZZZ